MPSKEHFFKEQKPRSSNMDRLSDTLNTNITERFKAVTSAGIESGFGIRYLDNTSAVIDGPNPQLLTDNAFKVAIGQGWDDAGERIIISADKFYSTSNVTDTDSQIPPVATPQSSGNTSIPFAKDAFSVNVDTFVCIKYLRVTDKSALPDFVPGFPFEYPKLDDGYEILIFNNSSEVSTALAGGALFLAFIQIPITGNPRAGDTYVSYQWPIGSASPTFERRPFGTDIVAHVADPNAHHNKAHSHTTADGSAETNPVTGAVSIGPGEQVEVGDENFRDNLSYQFEPGVVFDQQQLTTGNFYSPGVEDDIPFNALLVDNDLLNVVVPQTGSPDFLRVRQLRTGERIFVDGRVKSQVTGSLASIVDPITLDEVYQVAVPNVGGSAPYYFVINGSGALEVIPKPDKFPIDKFVIGEFIADSGDVTGGPGGFTDLRKFGTVGFKSFNSNSVRELATFDTFANAVQATGISVWIKYTVNATQLNSTGTFQSIKIQTLPARAVIEGVILKHTAPFDPITLAGLTVEVGILGELDRHASPFDIYQPVGPTVSKASSQVSPEDFIGTTDVYATFRIVGPGQVDYAQGSGGSLDVYLKYSVIPA